MATAEMEFDSGRRNFLTLGFARRSRGRGGQPPRRPTSRPSSASPQPPDWGGLVVNRRKVIIGGSIVIGTAIGAVLLKPWTWFTRLPEIPESDTLDSLVAKAKKMEEEFSENDLSNEPLRNNFTAVLAGIYSKDSPSNYSKEQIAESVIWARNLDQFIKLVADNSQRQRGERSRDYFTDIPAITTDNKKIIINLANPAFDTSVLRRGGLPRDWNSLKSLRHVLLHEFVHLTTIPKQDAEFFDLTDIPKNVTDPIIEGFLVQFKEAGQDREIFHIINELVVETITNEKVNRLFGLTPPIQFIEQGVDLSTTQPRLRQVLDAAGISVTDLERFNRSSDIYGFLVALSSRVNFPSDTSLAERINYVLSVLDAVLYNNQTLIQEYINRSKAQ